MASRRIVVLSSVLAVIGAAALVAWVVGSKIESPADAAARTAPPTPSPILVPVEKRVLGSNIVTRGSVRFGLPQPVSIAPSVVKAKAGLIATLPARNTQFSEGEVILTASGRPVFVLRGKEPAYRDFAPGTSGDDVRQLEEALKRLGFDPGPIDGNYDQRTAAAVEKLYRKKGWEPFGPTPEQLVAIRVIERDWGDAAKLEATTASAASAAALGVESARATAENNNRRAALETAAKSAELQRQKQTLRKDSLVALENERAKAKHANAAAEADLAAQLADRALIELDPRQLDAVRINANAKLEMARAAAQRTQLSERASVEAAERAVSTVDERLKQAQDAEQAAQLTEKSTRLEGEKAILAALDAQKLAQLDAKLASERARQLAADLANARSRIGIQMPVDEIVFIGSLPVRVEELKSSVGGTATGTVMTVTDNQLAIDGALSLEAAALVTAGMPVAIDEQALGVKATGVVAMVAGSPGTRGVDGFHVYFEVKVDDTKAKLDGVSVRLTIPIKSTQGAVTAVPNSAISLSADGTSRVQVKRGEALQYVVVTPGLAADGYVEVTPLNAKLEPGDLVVVGYNNPKSADAKATDAKATESKSTDAKSADSKATNSQPTESK